jgi:predicted O-linked N-acetylglucosamine transferase (SPINDLY family)
VLSRHPAAGRNGLSDNDADAAQGDEQMSLAEQALAIPPLTTSKHAYVDVLFMQARILQRDGQLAAAKASYKKVLKRRPNHFDAWHLLGVCELLSRDYEEAARSLKRALLLDSESVAARSDLGVVLKALRRPDEALACFDRVIDLNPDFTNGHYNRGSLLLGMRRFDEALKSLDDAIAIDPHHANALINRASVLINLGRFADAVASSERAIALQPACCDALVKRGLALLHLTRAKEAIVDFDLALSMAPDHALAWAYRGEALRFLERFSEALASSDKALAINPELFEGWKSRGYILVLLKKVTEAEAAFQRALAIQPDNADIITLLGQCLELKGDGEAALACFDRALAIEPDLETALSAKIFALDFSGDRDFAAHQAARSEWWRKIGEKIAADRPWWCDNDFDPDRRIVVGYVSADFRNHSAAFAVRPVLQNHDRSQFEVICYSGTNIEDEVTASFRQCADRWRDVLQCSDEQLADCIRTDKVDILIDLSGHSCGNRLRTFARKPAPIQVTAWGHASGTGVPTIDYLFSDPVLIPTAVRHLFAEKVYDLPCAVIIEPPPAGLRTVEPPVTLNGHLTYGVLNRVSRISDSAIGAWARILRSDLTSKLLIKDHLIDDVSIQNMLLEKFAAHGVGSDRIVLMGSSSREQHLAAYRRVDICLDPFPHAGGVSTWEALHMGVPVVTRLGNAIAKRVGGAILSSVGLGDWIATDDDEYVDIALRSTPDRLKELRCALPALIDERCSPAAYARAVEEAYRAMWKKRCDELESQR